MSGPASKDESFAALSVALIEKVDNPDKVDVLALHYREFLVNYAALNIDQNAHASDQAQRLAVGRTQALYVAGMLANIDGPDATTPFKDSELAGAYERQQNYLRSKQNEAQSHDQTKHDLQL